jgi:hypothetical protein
MLHGRSFASAQEGRAKPRKNDSAIRVNGTHRIAGPGVSCASPSAQVSNLIEIISAEGDAVSALGVRTVLLPTLKDVLLIQGNPSDLGNILGVLRPGAGMALSGNSAMSSCSLVRDAGWDGPLVVDRRLYAGAGRKLAVHGFSEAWLHAQDEAGLDAIFTDSGYIDARDFAGLDFVLDDAERIAADLGQPVVAVLPLNAWWLSEGLRALLTALSRTSLPIALALEHSRDPLSVRRNLDGLVAVLRTCASRFQTVILLTSDTSALGALAFGATSAAFGVRPSLRHLYPRKGGGAVDSRPSALMDAVLSILKVDKIALGVSRDPGHPRWFCECSTCSGRTLDWLSLATPTEALLHTLERMLDLRDSLVRLSTADRERSWRAKCGAAAFEFENLGLAGVLWDVPGFLRHWPLVA